MPLATSNALLPWLSFSASLMVLSRKTSKRFGESKCYDRVGLDSLLFNLL